MNVRNIVFLDIIWLSLNYLEKKFACTYHDRVAKFKVLDYSIIVEQLDDEILFDGNELSILNDEC